MSDKVALPKTKFSHDLTPGPIEPTMKAAEATTTKLYRIPVGKIKTIPGFNVRVESDEYIAHRDNIRALIAANGYDSTKPLAGYVAKEGDDNVIYVTDGHTRLAAVEAYNDEVDAADRIATLPVLVHSKEVSLTDLTVALHTANSGRPLTPYELGVVVKRLLADESADKKEIAGRLGVTTRYLDDVLLLADADTKVKRHVASGAVSSTLAIEVLRKDPDSAAEKLETAIKKTEGTGKKATKKHIGLKTVKVRSTHGFIAGDDMKEIVKVIAAKVRDAIEAEEDGDVKLATVAGVIKLEIEVPSVEKEPAKPKAKPKTNTKGKAKKPAEDEAPAPKKAKAKAAPKKKAKPAEDDLGIEGAESLDADDEEIAKLPPKVASDDGEEDEVDI